MTYFAVYDTATGDLISTGTTVATDEELAEQGYTKAQLTGDGPPSDKLWNPTTKKFDVPAAADPAEPGPPPTVDEALAADVDYNALSAQEKRITRVVARIAAKAARSEVSTE